jgi:hypothetical protein
MKRTLSLLLMIVTVALFSFQSTTAQTIQKPSVHIRLQVHKGFKGDPETWGWTPVINFRVNGPFSPGGAVSVEYSLPGKTWKFDCNVEEAGGGLAWGSRLRTESR